jgi:serine hydrolase
VLLVSPPQPDVEVPGSIGFRPVPLDADAVAAAAGETRLVCSTDDPWCPRERSAALGEEIGVEVEWLEDAGHVNTDAGFGPWPTVEAWALAERERPI